ncbi:MAG: hypothetical protein ICV60_04860 [Pyrinomonadaceae bacterium]|nr:hypothetical protein [Pyrinomonadaceae bacterium]
MRIVFRKTVRKVVLLLVAFSTFIVGLTAFYFYAEAAAFLFMPKQPTPETTLSAQAAAPPISQPPFTFSTPEYRAKNSWEPACENCVQDKDFGLCELLDGEYTNDEYLYAVTIPAEVQAMRAPAPAPNHGFVARILSDYNAVIYVDGSYDSAFLDSTTKAATAELNYLREEYGESVVLLERKSLRLGKRAALRYRAQYTDKSTGETMIEDAVVTLRKDNSYEDEVGIIYSIKLRSSIYTHKDDYRVFEQMLKNWRELEMDHC